MKKLWHSVFIRIVGVLALILVGIMIYSATTGGLATIPETIAGTVITPIQTAISAVSGGIDNLFDRLAGKGVSTEEMEALKKENEQLRAQMVDYDELKQKNQWYSEILGLHEEHSDYTFATGRVIGQDPTSPYGSFTISAGSGSHVKVNDPVITTDGSLIGVVEEVGLTYSRIRTVLDAATKVSAQISRTGDTGYTSAGTVKQARNNTLKLTALDRSSGTAVGDYVVTSGIGGVYPGGLLMGKVIAVNSASDGMTLDADVELFGDVFNLKQVMVITSFYGQGNEDE